MLRCIRTLGTRTAWSKVCAYMYIYVKYMHICIYGSYSDPLHRRWPTSRQDGPRGLNRPRDRRLTYEGESQVIFVWQAQEEIGEYVILAI